MTRLGYKQTPEHRARIAAAKRRQYEDPAERELQRQRGRARRDAHGMVGTGVYVSWYAMKRRVKTVQPKDAIYYAHVDMDPRWEYFENFYSDMGERPAGRTLDRVDGERGYWPDNCRWATHSEQRLNRRVRQPS